MGCFLFCYPRSRLILKISCAGLICFVFSEHLLYHENKAYECDYRCPAFPGGQHADQNIKSDTNRSAERVGKHIIPLKQSPHQKQLERLDGEGEQDS